MFSHTLVKRVSHVNIKDVSELLAAAMRAGPMIEQSLKWVQETFAPLGIPAN